LDISISSKFRECAPLFVLCLITLLYFINLQPRQWVANQMIEKRLRTAFL
jgi:hypothetical protein